MSARQTTLQPPRRKSQRSLPLPEQRHIILTPNAFSWRSAFALVEQHKAKRRNLCCVSWPYLKLGAYENVCLRSDSVFRCLFSIKGCDVGHVYLLDPSLVTHQSPEKNQRAVQDSSSRREEIFWDETLISHGLGFPSRTQCCLSVRGRLRERRTLKRGQ